MRTYTDQEVIKFIDQAPPLIQDAVGSMDTARIVAELGQKKDLHIDQIGKVAELNRNMLLGLIDPEEFLEGLRNAGIADADARDIISTLNKKIFVPLHEEVRSASSGRVTGPAIGHGPVAESGTAQESVVVPQPAEKTVVSVAEPVHVPEPQPAAPVKAPVAPSPSALPPKLVLPRSGSVELHPPVPAKTFSPERTLETEVTPTNRMLEDHEEPSPMTRPIVPAPVQPAAPQPAPAVVLPGSIPPQPVSQQQPNTISVDAPSPMPGVPKKLVVPAPKTYASDPYREPIDDVPAQ